MFKHQEILPPVLATGLLPSLRNKQTVFDMQPQKSFILLYMTTTISKEYPCAKFELPRHETS